MVPVREVAVRRTRTPRHKFHADCTAGQQQLKQYAPYLYSNAQEKVDLCGVDWPRSQTTMRNDGSHQVTTQKGKVKAAAPLRAYRRRRERIRALRKRSVLLPSTVTVHLGSDRILALHALASHAQGRRARICDTCCCHVRMNNSDYTILACPL